MQRRNALLAALCLAAATASAAGHRRLQGDADVNVAAVSGLHMNEPGTLESIRGFMISRSATLHPNLYALLEAATFGAKSAVPAEQRDALFKNMGHIGQVPDEVSFYAHAAHLHDVHLIGEIGFNAGHSAVTMLFQTHHSVLVSFDIEELAYSKTSLEFVQLMYPNRLERIVGSSIETVPVFAAKDKRKFDLFAIDGMHNAEFPYMDMSAGRNASRPGAYVLIDDHSDSFPDVVRAWDRAKKEGWITEILCVDKGIAVDGYKKAYCLGQYAA